jgi:hypothetical protein
MSTSALAARASPGWLPRRASFGSVATAFTMRDKGLSGSKIVTPQCDHIEAVANLKVGGGR